MDTLNLQSSIDDMNLKANQVYKASGQLPPQSSMPDTRTTTEKLGDAVKLKANIVKELKELVDAQNAQYIIQTIEASPLNASGSFFLYFAQNVKEIVTQLKKKYGIGIAGNNQDIQRFVNFIEKSYNDTKEMSGTIKSAFNRPVSRASKLNPTDLNTMKDEFKTIGARIVSKYGIRGSNGNGGTINRLINDINEAFQYITRFTITSEEFIAYRNELMNATPMAFEASERANGRSNPLLLYDEVNIQLSNLPSLSMIYALFDQLQSSMVNNDDLLTIQILRNILSLFDVDELMRISYEMQQLLNIIGRRPPGGGGGDDDDDDDGDLLARIRALDDPIYFPDVPDRPPVIVSDEDRRRNADLLRRAAAIRQGPSMPPSDDPTRMTDEEARLWKEYQDYKKIKDRQALQVRSDIDAAIDADLARNLASGYVYNGAPVRSGPVAQPIRPVVPPVGDFSVDPALQARFDALRQAPPPRPPDYSTDPALQARFDALRGPPAQPAQSPGLLPSIGGAQAPVIIQPQSDDDDVDDLGDASSPRPLNASQRAEASRKLRQFQQEQKARKPPQSQAVDPFAGMTEEQLYQAYRNAINTGGDTQPMADASQRLFGKYVINLRQPPAQAGGGEADNEPAGIRPKQTAAQRQRQQDDGEAILRAFQAKKKANAKAKEPEPHISDLRDFSWTKLAEHHTRGTDQKPSDYLMEILRTSKKLTQEEMDEITEAATNLDAQGRGLVRGRGRPKGSGIARPFKDKIDSSRGIEPDRRFVKFGKYLVNTHKLNDDIFAIKTPSGANITSHPSQRVSPHLSHVFKKIIGGGVPSFNELSKLNDDEKNYLYNVSKKAEIADKLSIPTPSKDQKEQDIHEYEVMKGEILSGNDNKDLIKRFKIHMSKLSRQGVLPKKEVNEILTDLLELGH
jgi:hypothetical protein